MNTVVLKFDSGQSGHELFSLDEHSFAILNSKITKINW